MRSDLVVVVADGGIEQAMRGILSRPLSIGIRAVRGVEYPKARLLDAGVFAHGHELAARYRTTHEHALLMLDLAWEGRPTDDPDELTRLVEHKLRPMWGDAARCVVINPELEVWIWSESPHVGRELGWGDTQELRRWLEQGGFWARGSPKPAQPQEAYLRAIRERRVERSNATFRAIAEKVSLQGCRDPAFLRLPEIMRSWSPAPLSASTATRAESA